ncbi:MAG TPA: DUF397 domain-containing protein [Streptomyces sp.]|uniref:DUF397 domain-containing protein n=1 Tax=Streptomyces sp. ADI98-10 TaxID=1522763 RepID=UPI000E88F74B|nr:DUF397 domain-containing protein [Streptomyces sp. ADI98-10]HBF85737.1 DUF397 domain-containing protein [Streptomyces sp.]
MAEQSQEPQWFTSSYSASPDNECVEVANMPKRTWVRDSKRPDGPRTDFSHSAWAAFTAHVGSEMTPLLG